MRSNAGMANRQGDVDLRFAQVSAPQLELWLGLAWLGCRRPMPEPLKKEKDKAFTISVSIANFTAKENLNNYRLIF